MPLLSAARELAVRWPAAGRIARPQGGSVMPRAPVMTGGAAQAAARRAARIWIAASSSESCPPPPPGALTTGCGTSVGKLMPLLVPEHEIVPGEEQWHPAVCTECGAGCGTLVAHHGRRARHRAQRRTGSRARRRRQEDRRQSARPDQRRQPLRARTGGGAVAVSSGSSARPDEAHRRPRQRPVRRDLLGRGDRLGSRENRQGASRRSRQDRDSHRRRTRARAHWRIERFAQGARRRRPRWSARSRIIAVERKAAELVFGWKGLPVYDLANAHLRWASARTSWAAGLRRSTTRGSSATSGKDAARCAADLVQAESRLSITACAADRWLPLRPGSEPQFLAAVGRILLDRKLARNAKASAEAGGATLSTRPM